jgi:4-hydroxy-3-methylbut-2-enyl diphosphate reductase
MQHLQRFGVVNQTTQLATDTQAIAEYLKNVMREHYGLTATDINTRFADTRDTLCYATNDNQSAVTGMLQTQADLAIIVGGYNSSNTSHLVELCEQKLPSYFIDSAGRMLSEKDILHCNWRTKEETLTHGFLPPQNPVKVLITSGASCPDAIVEEVIRKLAGFFGAGERIDELAAAFE